MPDPILLTVDETSALLRTTQRAIYVMVERRQLPGITRIGRRLLFRSADLLRSTQPGICDRRGSCVCQTERPSRRAATEDAIRLLDGRLVDLRVAQNVETEWRRDRRGLEVICS